MIKNIAGFKPTSAANLAQSLADNKPTHAQEQSFNS